MLDAWLNIHMPNTCREYPTIRTLPEIQHAKLIGSFGKHPGAHHGISPHGAPRHFAGPVWAEQQCCRFSVDFVLQVGLQCGECRLAVAARFFLWMISRLPCHHHCRSECVLQVATVLSCFLRHTSHWPECRSNGPQASRRYSERGLAAV